jgi:hypothetical protein
MDATFPNSPIIPVLSEEDKKEPYGFNQATASRRAATLLRELQSFMDWSSNPLQLDRAAPYRATQSDTNETTRKSVLGFMGFLNNYKGVPPQQLSICWYRHSLYIADFTTFLTARGVGKAMLKKHITLAVKVNTWLQLGWAPWKHHQRMVSWLEALRVQLPVLATGQRGPQQLPEAEAVYAWVDERVIDCRDRCVDDW